MKVPAGEFKAKCLQIMDEVQKKKEEVIITKHGKPVARMLPVNEVTPRPLFGFLKGTVQIHADITAPLDEAWEADSDE